MENKGKKMKKEKKKKEHVYQFMIYKFVHILYNCYLNKFQK